MPDKNLGELDDEQFLSPEPVVYIDVRDNIQIPRERDAILTPKGFINDATPSNENNQVAERLKSTNFKPLHSRYATTEEESSQMTE